MSKPLAITGFFRLNHPDRKNPEVFKVVYIEKWDHQYIQSLLQGGYEFIPVHVFTDEELAEYVKNKLLSG